MKTLISLTAVLAMTASTVVAATLADLKPAHSYRSAGLTFEGNQHLSDSELIAVMQTKTRPNYQLWKPRPEFDADTFSADLDRLKQLYRSRGYYAAVLHYKLDIKGGLVYASIDVAEGEPILVAAVSISAVGGAPSPMALEPRFKPPLNEGGIFDEAQYRLGAQQLLNLYQRHGYPFATASRRAELYLTSRQVYVWYTARPGLHGVFGTSIVAGAEKVDPVIVLRELSYRPGEEFDSSKVAASRQKILRLNLFRSVDLEPRKDPSNPGRFPITVQVHEKTARELNLMLGYNTETLLNASLQWTHYNWLGGGRQLLLGGTYSDVRSTLDAKLIQPYLLSPDTRGILEALVYQETYQTYTLNAYGLRPRLDLFVSPNLTATLGWRFEYLKFTTLDPRTIAALGRVRRQGILSGPTASFIYNTADDPLDPQGGTIFSLQATAADRIFGSDYRYWRTLGEARHYQSLGAKIVLATRFRLGLADTFGPRDDIPLSERFYSGGEASVRGYGLRRIGRLSPANEPLGGLSLIEGSVELRRPLFWKLGGALFFDCGQVTPRPFHIPADALQCGVGPALTVSTPVGPMRVDLGFPIKRPHHDSSWQIYFSIGQFY